MNRWELTQKERNKVHDSLIWDAKCKDCAIAMGKAYQQKLFQYMDERGLINHDTTRFDEYCAVTCMDNCLACKIERELKGES